MVSLPCVSGNGGLLDVAAEDVPGVGVELPLVQDGGPGFVIGGFELGVAGHPDVELGPVAPFADGGVEGRGLPGIDGGGESPRTFHHWS